MSTPARSSASLALLTDLYELTMAFGYWRAGLRAHEAVFHLFFRSNPFGGGFAIACGLASVVDYLERLRFLEDDVDYLRELRGNDGRPLFEEQFLDALREMELAIDLDAVPEGTAVFAREPLVRVRGPLLQCQIVETALLNLVNFQTLAATKAARICLAAGGDPVLEFGLRRAQGMDGGLAASRAAYVGGCDATSNVLAGKLFGIPVRGTHAHSWVMCFEEEQEAFEAYGRALPHNCVFLVDTYDTLAGVRHAVEVAARLRAEGVEMTGIRIDSGDLAGLSREARRILDEAGFPQAVIMGSSDLDEARIAQLKEKGAEIGAWGVGTRLATAYDEPALTGVYKLAAIRAPGEPWRHRIKLSDEPEKATLPGIQQTCRYEHRGTYVGDVIYDAEQGSSGATDARDLRTGHPLALPEGSEPSRDLLVPVYRGGERVYDPPPVAASREHALEEIARLPEGVKRRRRAERYPVGIDSRLLALRDAIAARRRG
jgi:nicotinate phosphoribosyltransferase